MVRQDSLSCYDEAKYDKMTNRLQVTILNRTLCFDLDRDKIVLINELYATDQLVDQNNFVETGLSLSHVQKVSKFGGFGLKFTLKASQLGNLVTYQMKAVNAGQVKESSFRFMLGVYKQHAAIDFQEMSKLLAASKQGIKPKKIDK